MFFACRDNGRDLNKHHVRYFNSAAAERKRENPASAKPLTDSQKHKNRKKKTS